MRPLGIDRRAILALAWPVIATNLLTTAVSWIDLLMVSRLGKETVAAVGLATFLQTLLWTVLMSLQIGTSILVAQAWGAGKRRRAERVTTQALAIAAALALALSAVFCGIGGRPLLYRAYRLFDAEPAVADIGARYLWIVLLVLVGFSVSLVGQAALRSIGDTRTPLWLTGFSNVVNAALNYILIFGALGAPALGVEGAAWGTVIARSFEALAYLALLRGGRLGLSLRPAEARPQRHIAAALLRLGWPAGAEQLVMTTGFLLYTRVVTSYGTDALAAYQIGVVLLQAAFMPGFGFSVAATTLVGQWVGAGRRARARAAAVRCRNLAVVLMSGLGVAFVLLARPWARLVLDDAVVVEHTVVFIRLLALSQPAMAVHFALSGALRGASDVRSPLLAALLAMYGARLPISMLAAWVWQAPLVWVWIGMVAAHHLRALVLHLRFRRRHR